MWPVLTDLDVTRMQRLNRSIPATYSIFYLNGEYHGEPCIPNYDAVAPDDDFTKVYNWVVDAIGSDGGKIALNLEGKHYYTDALKMKHRIIVEGLGPYTTILKQADGANTNCFEWTPSGSEYFAGLRNLMIDGNRDNNTTGKAVYMTGTTRDFETYRVWIYNMPNEGYISSGTTWGHKHFGLIIEACNSNGASITDNNAVFVGCRFADNTYNGVTGTVRRPMFLGCEFQANGYNGLNLEGYTDAPTVDVCHAKVIGCTFECNGSGGGAADQDAQIRLGSKAAGCEIMGNTFDGYRAYPPSPAQITDYGIYFGVNTAVNNVIGGNHFKHHNTAPVGGVGGFDFIDNNRYGINHGFMTENSGYNTIANGTTSVVVTHGLDYTPLAEQITIIGKENPTNSVGTIWVDTIGAASFTVNVENDPGASDWDFGWAVRLVR